MLFLSGLLSKNRHGIKCFKKNFGKGISHSDTLVARQEGPAWSLHSYTGVHGSKQPPGLYKWSLIRTHARLTDPCSLVLADNPEEGTLARL